jgi:hypothetical protein
VCCACTWQWAYKQTNKREAEDQMVRHIEEYDGMAAMAQAVPQLMMTSSRFSPHKPVRPNLDFPGATTSTTTIGFFCCFNIFNCLMVNQLWEGMDEFFPPVKFKGRMKLMKLSEKVVAPAVGSKWQRYHVAMKFLPRCLRMHLAGRPDRVQNEDALPMPDDKKVCQNV